MALDSSLPSWLDRSEYPFDSHWLQLESGRMHYIDEGQGHPIVMVHGTPDWSFGFRHLVKNLSPHYRCIAPDHLGFGLSDKPRGGLYSPQAQAANLRSLVEALKLRDVTLLLHDFGGPFGFAYAIDQPDNVRNLVLMNTWMWSLRGDPHFEQFGRLFNNPLGRFLYLQFNFSARVIMPMATADRKLPLPIHQQYTRALATPADREGTWQYAQALLGASDWYDSLWRRRDRIEDKPTLILWGMRDTAFREQELLRLESIFKDHQTVRLEDAGHFIQEEQPEKACAAIPAFLRT